MNLRSWKANTAPTARQDGDGTDSSDSAVLSCESNDESDNVSGSSEQPIVRKKCSSKDVKLVSSTSFKKRGFTCPECPESFPREAQLRVHSRLHTGERRFVCSFDGCQFRTTLGAILRAHARQHTGEKPFKCKFAGCDYAAKQSGPLRTHERRHTGEKPYVCGIETCPQKFTQRASLVQHILRKHRNNSYKDAVGFHLTPSVPSQPVVDLLAGKDRKDRIMVAVPEESLSSDKTSAAKRNLRKIRNALRKLSAVAASTEATQTPQPVRCTFANCNFSADESEIRRHFSHHISKKHKRRCICDVAGCITSYFSYRGLMKHHQETHSTTQFKRDDLDKPQRLDRIEKTYLCGIDGCTKIYTRLALRQHVSYRHAGKDLSDTMMDRCEDDDGAELQQMLASLAQKETFQCQGYQYRGCTFKCYDKDELEEHKRLIHYKGQKLYLCGIDGCDYRGSHADRLRCHVTYRHPQADYEKDAIKREVTFLRPAHATQEHPLAATEPAVDEACTPQESILSAIASLVDVDLPSRKCSPATASPMLFVVEDTDMDEVAVQSPLDETIREECEVKPAGLKDRSRLEEVVDAVAGTEVTLAGMKVVGLGPCSVPTSTGERQFGYFVTFGDSAGCTPVLLPAEQVPLLLRQEFHANFMQGLYFKLA